MATQIDQPAKRGRGRPRKQPSADKPTFISGVEIARELGISPPTLYRWVAEESFPEQRCRPGACTRLWLRAHWDEFVTTGKWPKEAWRPLGGRR